MSGVATVKVELSDGQLDLLLACITDLLDRTDAMERRIDALERRIDRLEGMLDGMGKGAASRIEAIELRIERMERKLNHKGGDE